MQARCFAVVLSAGAWLLAAAGCATPGQPPRSAASAPVVLEAPGRAAIVVHGSQSGAEVVVHRPQALRVELASDTGAVTRGFEWTLSAGDPALLTVGGTEFERASRDVNEFESAGTTIFRFAPRAAGRTTLEFALRRPRTLDPPAATVRFDVVVR